MKKIAIHVSLLALIFAVSSCNKGCIRKEKTEAAKAEAPALEKSAQGHVDKPGSVDKKGKGTEMDELIKEFGLKPGDKLVAQIDTNMGTIKANLFWEKAPNTVGNFANLALGKKEWVNTDHKKTSNPLYSGTIFHRVIKGFMIQGGDPAGNGSGGPGYKFKDEFDPSLKHDRPGILSMANAGPNTNGSQFFITEGPTPHLNNRHSVFGAVEDNDSLKIVGEIANVKTDRQDRPEKDVVINKISIVKG